MIKVQIAIAARDDATMLFAVRDELLRISNEIAHGDRCFLSIESDELRRDNYSRWLRSIRLWEQPWAAEHDKQRGK